MIFGIIPLFFLELFISMKVGEEIGFGSSVLWIMLSMLFGIVLLRSSPYAFMGNIMSVQMGKLDLKSANNASMAYLFGSILLIVPGVMSDIMGVGMLLYTLYLRLLAKIRPQQKQNYKRTEGDDDVIDVEIIDE